MLGLPACLCHFYRNERALGNGDVLVYVFRDEEPACAAQDCAPAFADKSPDQRTRSCGARFSADVTLRVYFHVRGISGDLVDVARARVDLVYGKFELAFRSGARSLRRRDMSVHGRAVHFIRIRVDVHEFERLTRLRVFGIQLAIQRTGHGGSRMDLRVYGRGERRERSGNDGYRESTYVHGIMVRSFASPALTRSRKNKASRACAFRIPEALRVTYHHSMNTAQWRFANRTAWIAVAITAVLLWAFASPARSAGTGTWTGTVVYINNSHIGVKSQSQTRDFLIDKDTGYVENGKPSAHGSVQPGALVSVTYLQSTFFGSTRATRVEITSFSWPAPQST